MFGFVYNELPSDIRVASAHLAGPEASRFSNGALQSKLVASEESWFSATNLWMDFGLVCAAS